MKLVTFNIYIKTRSNPIHTILMSLCSMTLFSRVPTLDGTMNKVDFVWNYTAFNLTIEHCTIISG